MDRHQELTEIQRKWRPPAELLVPGERVVRMTTAGKVMAVFAWFFALGGAAIGIGMQLSQMRQVDTQNQLEQHGVDVDATVTRVWRTTGKHSASMVDYEFETAGQVYRGSTPAPDPIWFELKAGSKLAVRFVPADPSRHHPRDWPMIQMPAWLGAFFFVLFVPAGIRMVVFVRGQLALLRRGGVAAGVVTKYSYGGSRQQVVNFEFAVPDGSLGSGKTQPMSQVPAIGSILCVLYDPERPRRNALYPLSLARIVEPGSSGS